MWSRYIRNHISEGHYPIKRVVVFFYLHRGAELLKKVAKYGIIKKIKKARKVEKKIVVCGIIIVCEELKEYEGTDFGCPADAGLYRKE